MNSVDIEIRIGVVCVWNSSYIVIIVKQRRTGSSRIVVVVIGNERILSTVCLITRFLFPVIVVKRLVVTM